MVGKTSKRSAKVAKKACLQAGRREASLLAGSNPQIAKGDGDGSVQAYIEAMPGWKHDVEHRIDALIARTVPNVRKAVRWNTPLVPRLSLPHEVRQDFFLPRQVAASGPARRVQAKGRALPRHPRGRPARRSSIHRVGEASQSIVRQTNVSGKSRDARVARAKVPSGGLRPKLLST
jgi:hypothetical protein